MDALTYRYFAGLLLLTVLVGSANSVVGETSEVFSRPVSQYACRSVHGRMTIYNGTAAFRIWIVGTHRMLRVVGTDGYNAELKDFPRNLSSRMIATDQNPFDYLVFADFNICDYTKSRPRVMQSVILVGAKNIHIVKDKVFN